MHNGIQNKASSRRMSRYHHWGKDWTNTDYLLKWIKNRLLPKGKIIFLLNDDRPINVTTKASKNGLKITESGTAVDLW